MFDIFYDDHISAVLFFVVGLLFGSFANVVIYRLPNGESVVFPGSKCPSCNTKISWYDNIPVLSWLVLRGQCRSCKSPISWRYPIIETLCGFVFMGVFLVWGWQWVLLEYLLLAFGLVVISFIDLEHMIIPDFFSIGGVLVGLFGALVNPERDYWLALAGFFMGGGTLYLISSLYAKIAGREGLGGGDIKLLAWIGAVLGPKAVFWTIMSSSIFGSFVGVFIAVLSKKGLRTAIPFGPYLALGAIGYVLGAYVLTDWYFDHFPAEWSGLLSTAHPPGKLTFDDLFTLIFKGL